MDAEINDLQALCDAKDAELYKAECEIERLRGLVGLESTDLDLDWSRLRSGDNRALIPDHQDVFDMVAGMRRERDEALADIERLRTHIAEIEAWREEGQLLFDNYAVGLGAMFGLGKWWGKRPWGKR
jgi:hypothetical protein